MIYRDCQVGTRSMRLSLIDQALSRQFTAAVSPPCLHMVHSAECAPCISVAALQWHLNQITGDGLVGWQVGTCQHSKDLGSAYLQPMHCQLMTCIITRKVSQGLPSLQVVFPACLQMLCAHGPASLHADNFVHYCPVCAATAVHIHSSCWHTLKLPF